MSTANMNIQPSKKYGFSPEEVERRALESERLRIVYNMHRLKKTDELNQGKTGTIRKNIREKERN